jgi:hypothetical protein
MIVNDNTLYYREAIKEKILPRSREGANKIRQEVEAGIIFSWCFLAGFMLIILALFLF